jgi:hypothetical protein
MPTSTELAVCWSERCAHDAVAVASRVRAKVFTAKELSAEGGAGQDGFTGLMPTRGGSFPRAKTSAGSASMASMRARFATPQQRTIT